MIEGMSERDERPWEPCQMNRREIGPLAGLFFGLRWV